MERWKRFTLWPLVGIFFLATGVEAQHHSVARVWNEAQLDAVRLDFARPTVHARNFFHAAVAMYDAWAVYDDVAEPFLLGKTVGGFTVPFSGIVKPANLTAARNEAISYAMYRLLTHRFRRSPGAARSLAEFDSLMRALGYETTFTSTDYAAGSPAALGNYVAEAVINFGLQDGANEQNNYADLYYKPYNPPLVPVLPGNPKLTDPNRWQPLELDVFVDQAGNVVPGDTTKFVNAEWGQVVPFSLSRKDLTIHQRNGFNFWVYHDPGPPPCLNVSNGHSALSEYYHWAFSLVATWSSHLDPSDGVKMDISPASLGNVQKLPETPEALRNFYDLLQGGDGGRGRALNPRTGRPYQAQIVPRGDYARVLAEFWADGPRSETPPGHWFTILNYVSDHPAFQKRFKGQGPILDDLEWDVKAYFALGGAVHDVAVTAWGIKGWYDYVRPISALRWMADRGQCSNPGLRNYSPLGLPLIPGFIESVSSDDQLAGFDGRNVGKIKVRAWRAHRYIGDPATDVAGVDWILAEEWWPYQRPTFVTPPFAGYISGHSTFSRAAAEVMTLLTGDEYFPGGMGEFHAPRNEYLVFEDGPSVDLTLQWATYRDASDQCSLSRIWGGIHPPVDDIPGRLIGRKIGVNAFAHAERYFNGQADDASQPQDDGRVPVKYTAQLYPNPVRSGNTLQVKLNRPASEVLLRLYNVQGQLLQSQVMECAANQEVFSLSTPSLPSGVYFIRVSGEGLKLTQRLVILE